MDINQLRNCAYTILDNAQAIMMEVNRPNPYGGYLLEKARPIENDIQILKRQCLISETENNQDICSICGKKYEEKGNIAQPINYGTCCDKCNSEIVIPRRVQDILNKKKGEKNNGNTSINIR